MKVLVTGGSGYLGSHVRRFFEADNLSRRVNLDILNPYDAEIVANYDVVIHLAAHLDKDPAAADACFRTNVEGTTNLLCNMRADSVFVYASTKDVYGSFADEYEQVPETCRVDYCGQSALEWSKLIGERYVEYYAQARGFRSCIFRASTIYARPSDGNDPGFVTHYVESVKYGTPIRLPLDGQPVRDILHVDDFARACRAFIDSGVRTGLYNIGGGIENSASLSKIVDTISGIIQCSAVIDKDNPLPPPVPLNYVSDLSRVIKELGWKPEMSLEGGLRDLL